MQESKKVAARNPRYLAILGNVYDLRLPGCLNRYIDEVPASTSFHKDDRRKDAASVTPRRRIKQNARHPGMGRVPAIVASREEQLGDSEIKEDRTKDKGTRQTRYRIQGYANEPQGSVDLHLDTFGSIWSQSWKQFRQFDAGACHDKTAKVKRRTKPIFSYPPGRRSGARTLG